MVLLLCVYANILHSRIHLLFYFGWVYVAVVSSVASHLYVFRYWCNHVSNITTCVTE